MEEFDRLQSTCDMKYQSQVDRIVVIHASRIRLRATLTLHDPTYMYVSLCLKY